MKFHVSTGWLLTASVAWLSCGCSNSMVTRQFAKKEYYTPQNFHQETAWLPDDMRRVAVLPVNTIHTDHITSISHRQIDVFVGDAIAATEMFEIVRVTPKQLKMWTGRQSWTASETLPHRFFETLREKTGCEAVMFSELTVFKPYKPVAIGWKLHLIDANDPNILWASDLVFDSGNVAVANSAMKFSEENLGSGFAKAGSETILLSPARFGQYTLAASFGTLQGRKKNN